MLLVRLLAVFASVFASIALIGCGPSPSPGPGPVDEWQVCDHILMGTPEENEADVPDKATYATALEGLDMTQVAADMRSLLKDSKDCFPADGGDYGPLMVRLAWHCAGTFRNSDQVGGCGGGRQRFEPERSWPDNTNLDKARALIYPLKEQYGHALSWGDLFILAGTEALRASGAPLTRMCYGRIDEPNGTKSAILNEPCSPEQGNCAEPHGATTVGLIYVNPEGPMGVPDANGSVAEIRRTFGTMGHSDRATVALIGGGHTIGKAHGACPDGAGDSPMDAFAKDGPIWKGNCGSGVGADTTTSGFEGYWTTNPYEWDNEFFVESLASSGNNWEVHDGPGGHKQWRPSGHPEKPIFRLTSDIALLEDPDYLAIMQEFADDPNAFNTAFDAAWFKLTTTNVGGEWSTAAKCDDGSTPVMSDVAMRGDDVPSVVV